MSFEGRKLFDSLMETIPEFIFFKDLEGRFIGGNSGFLSYLHLQDLSQLLGKTDWDFFPEEQCRAAAADEQLIMTTGRPITNKLEEEAQANGSTRWVSTTKAAMRDDSGKVIGICGVSRDVTEEYRQKEALKNSNAALALKQAQIERELILARQIQTALLIEKYPVFGSPSPRGNAIDFAHHYMPQGSVGGDYFYIQRLSDTQASILISDVMGHGVHAALVTVAIKLVMEEIKQEASDPGKMLQMLNTRLIHTFFQLPEPVFVTAFYCILDLRTGEILYANAAHPAPIHLHSKGQTVTLLEPASRTRAFALAVSPEATYRTHRSTMEEGDQLFFYTDGLCDFDWMDKGGLEPPELMAVVQSCCTYRGSQLLESILQAITKLSGEKEFSDDVCLISASLNHLLS